MDWVQSNRKSMMLCNDPAVVRGDKLEIDHLKEGKEIGRENFFACELDEHQWSGAVLLEKGFNTPHFSTKCNPFAGNPKPTNIYKREVFHDQQ